MAEISKGTMFGSATTRDGTLHVMRPERDPVLGPVADCDSSLAITWLRPYDEHDGWRICNRSACRAAQTDERRKLGLLGETT